MWEMVTGRWLVGRMVISRLLRWQRVSDLGCRRKSLPELALCCGKCDGWGVGCVSKPGGLSISILLKLLEGVSFAG